MSRARACSAAGQEDRARIEEEVGRGLKRRARHGGKVEVQLMGVGKEGKQEASAPEDWVSSDKKRLVDWQRAEREKRQLAY